VTPTRPRTLLLLVLGFGALSYLVAALAYGSLPVLPRYAPVSIVLLTVVEAGMAKVVRDRLAHRLDGRGRPRAGRCTRCRSRGRRCSRRRPAPAGPCCSGLRRAAGLDAAAPQHAARDERDAAVAGFSAVGCLALVVAALVLERACRRRTP
jgi:hypothetical protein